MNEHANVDTATPLASSVSERPSLRLPLLLLVGIGISIAALPYGVHLRGSRPLAHTSDRPPIPTGRITAGGRAPPPPTPSPPPAGVFVLNPPPPFSPTHPNHH